MPPEIRVLDDDERRAAIALRFEVFVDEQRCPADEEVDQYDAQAVHFGAFVDGVLHGCCRVVDRGDGVVKIGRVAVRAALRRAGLGCVLMEHVVGWAGASGQRVVELDAQCRVVPFYERLGFVPAGDVFLEVGIEHVRMTRTLG